MKDLDFDELDKAVNSLMAGDKKPIDDDAAAPKSSIPSPINPPASLNNVESTTPLPPPPSPASRRPGRFMDVVHPSVVNKKPETTSPVSRQGISVEPRTPQVEETPKEEVKDVVEPKPDVPTPTSSSIEPHKETGDWPDPLDLASHSKTDDAIAAVDTKEETKEVTVPEKNILDDTPLTSPFLPDTKVEKRPLGANVSSAVPISSEVMIEDENAQLPANPKDVSPVLPEELHGDVVAIEADTTTKQPEVQAVEETPVWVAPESAKKTVSKKEEPPKIPGPVSIPQQYQEEPRTETGENGSIYDTDTYHQPLTHPAKQKSGWMWIVWILLIVVAGAAIGAALYFFKVV